MNNSFKVDEATDTVKIMIESKAVRSTAAVTYAEQLETDSEQSLFENQPSRSCTAVRTVDVGVMTSESSGSRTQADASTHHGGVQRFRLSHHLKSTCPPETTPQQERAGALMLPSSCLDGSVTPVGPRSKPTVHRCRPKTGGCGLPTRTQDEPTKQHIHTASCQTTCHLSLDSL